MHWYFYVLRSCFTFDKRAPRREFWTFWLVNGLIEATSLFSTFFLASSLSERT